MKKILYTLLCFVLLVSCKTNNDQSVGIIVPLTGGYSDVGQWMQMGIDLAIEDLKNQGVEINPIYEDSQSAPNTAIAAYQKLKSIQNIKCYISTVSSVCLALKPIVEKDKTFMFVNAGHKDLITPINDDVPSIYRHALTIPQEAEFIADAVFKKYPNPINISLLYTNNDIGVEFKDVFTARLQTKQQYNIYEMSYEESDTEIKNIIQKMNSKQPTIYVIYGYTKNFAPLIRTIREQGFNDDIFANQGFSTPSVIQGAGVAGNNVYYTDYNIPNSEEIKNLNNRALRKYGMELSPMSITSYNIMYIIGTVLNNTNNGDIELFKKELYSLKEININGMEVYINEGEVYVPLKLVKNIYN